MGILIVVRFHEFWLQATRARILDETISYIKSLEETFAELESQKKAMQLPQTERGTSVSVTSTGKTAFFAMCAVHRPGLLTQVLQVFNEHKAEVLAATVTRADGGCINVTVTAASMNEDEGGMERIRAELIAL